MTPFTDLGRRRSTPLQTATPRSRFLADGALLLVTLVWGSTFVVVKEAVEVVPMVTFLAVRFALAGAVLSVVFHREIRRGWRELARPGLVVGFFLWGGYILQTAGLRLTLASRAGFITGLSVVFVPILSMAVFRMAPPRRALVGVTLAVTGLALLFLTPGTAAGGAGATAAAGRALVGDLLVLACAVFFALHILSLGHFSSSRARSFGATGALAALQVDVAALGYTGAMAVLALSGRWDLVRPPAETALLAPAGAVVFTALAATAVAFLVQTAAQRHTPPTHTALILATEPVFAAIFGRLLLGETLGLWPVIGGLLILSGMVVAELPERRPQPG